MFRLFRALSLAGFGAAAALGADARPNIVVIMADDMGYSDAGCYGGEIETPNLDGLAANGLRFTNFYNASRCCPTRAALLTGLYPHQAGVGRMTFNQGSPGYEGRLKPHAMTVAEALRAAGYSTAMVGKWHLSLTKRTPKNAAWVSHRLDLGRFSDPQTYPVGRGFQEHWGTIWGVVDFFDPFSLVHNTKPVASVPDGLLLHRRDQRPRGGVRRKVRQARPALLPLRRPHRAPLAAPRAARRHREIRNRLRRRLGRNPRIALPADG